MTLVAAVQTMGIDCSVDLDIEEDEIDNHELSLGARFLMGILLGSLLFGFWHLAAKGFCHKWHANPLASSWQKFSIRKPVLEISKSVEYLEQDCGRNSSSHPVVDLISIYKGYGHVRTQVY